MHIRNANTLQDKYRNLFFDTFFICDMNRLTLSFFRMVPASGIGTFYFNIVLFLYRDLLTCAFIV